MAVDKPLKRRRNILTFSLKTFLMAVAGVAIFFAGRASNVSLRVGDERPIGDWKMQMKAGWGRQVVIIQTPNGDYRLCAAETVFNGIYVLKNDQLIMETPNLGSAKEFVWEWDGDGWTLAVDTPEQKYIGSRLVSWGYNERKKIGK